MNFLTKRQLKQKIEKTKVSEIIGHIVMLQRAQGAIDVKGEDLIEVAYLFQSVDHKSHPKVIDLLKKGKVKVFSSSKDSPFPLGDTVQAIFLEDTIICKK